MSNINVSLNKLSEKEKEYIKKYEKLYIQFHNDKNKLEGALFTLSLDYEDIDYKKVQDNIDAYIKNILLYKTEDHNYNFSKEFISLLKENISLPKLRLKFQIGGYNVDSFYIKDTKVRDNYLITNSNDGFLRIFYIDKEVEEFKFIKDISINQKEIYYYDLLENYIFYSTYENDLIVIDIITEKIIYNEKLDSEVLNIELDIDEKNIIIKYMNASQKVKIANNELIFLNITNKEIFNSYKNLQNLGYEYVGYLDYNQEKEFKSYYKYNQYINFLFQDSNENSNYLRTYIFSEETSKLIFDVSSNSPFKVDDNFQIKKELPNNIKIHIFPDGFVILKENKVYGTENWKDYVHFVDGLEIKDYQKWESLYDNAWCPEIMSEL